MQDGNGNDLSSFKIIDRGYTGHEHLLGVGLIHMNGRLYDPILHRFLAPDNYIQNPYDTQNYNRYSYVLNNPLMYTDPSGNFFLETIAIWKIVAWVVGLAITVAAAIWGSQNTGWSGAQGSASPQAPVTNAGSNGSQQLAAMANVPPEPGSGYRLEKPFGIWQQFKNGVINGYSRFWKNTKKEFKESVFSPWTKWKQNVFERGAWKNIIPGYTAYNTVAGVIGTNIHNFQVTKAGVSNLYHGNYYEAGEIYGHYQAEKHLEIGIMVVTAGIFKGVSAYSAAKTSTVGFKSFSAFKRAMGSAGNGKAWHHIVEQGGNNVAKFGTNRIHNPSNLIKLPHGKGSIHTKISGYYSSKQPFTGGQTVRQWLGSQSYQQQYDFGIRTLKQFGWIP